MTIYGTKQTDLKIYIEEERAKTILKMQNKIERLSTRCQCKNIGFKMASYCYRDRHISEWNRKETPERDS